METATDLHTMHKAATRDSAHALLALFICLLLTTVVQLFNLPTPSSDFLYILSYLIVFLFIAAPVIIFCISQHCSLRALGFIGSKMHFSNAIGMAIFFVVIFASPLLLNVLFTGQHTIASVFTTRTIAVFVISAIVEEYLFRGFLQPRLIAWKGPACGILLAAACFSLFHLPKLFLAGAGVSYLIIMCALIAIAGVIYGLAAYLFKDIYAAAWLHLAANVLLGML